MSSISRGCVLMPSFKMSLGAAVKCSETTPPAWQCVSVIQEVSGDSVRLSSILAQCLAPCQYKE